MPLMCQPSSKRKVLQCNYQCNKKLHLIMAIAILKLCEFIANLYRDSVSLQPSTSTTVCTGNKINTYYHGRIDEGRKTEVARTSYCAVRGNLSRARAWRRVLERLDARFARDAPRGMVLRSPARREPTAPHVSPHDGRYVPPPACARAPEPLCHRRACARAQRPDHHACLAPAAPVARGQSRRGRSTPHWQ